MSARKRRAARKIAILVKMVATISRMREQSSIVQPTRRDRAFAMAQALGRALARKGLEGKSKAAIKANRAADSVFSWSRT